MTLVKHSYETFYKPIKQVTAVKVSMTATIRSGDVGTDIRKSLKDQAFATPEKVAEMVAKVRFLLCHRTHPCEV